MTTETSTNPWRSLILRVAKTIAVALALVVALLTFPVALPWMIAVWLFGYSLAVFFRGATWFPLLLVFVVVLAKRPPFTPLLCLLLATMALLAAVNFVWQRRGRDIRRSRTAIVSAATLFVLWFGFYVEWQNAARCSRQPTIIADRPVVCFGDSITTGVSGDSRSPRGVRIEGGYPAVLSDRLSVPVINRGRPGRTAKQGAAYLSTILTDNPQVVVLGLGGNDFLSDKSAQDIEKNLRTIIEACHAAGAEVVLLEIPRGFITDPFGGLERRLAREYDLQLVPDTPIRRLVLSSPIAPPGMWSEGPHLSDDGLHPNALGNQMLARYVEKALVDLFGPAILKNTESK